MKRAGSTPAFSAAKVGGSPPFTVAAASSIPLAGARPGSMLMPHFAAQAYNNINAFFICSDNTANPSISLQQTRSSLVCHHHVPYHRGRCIWEFTIQSGKFDLRRAILTFLSYSVAKFPDRREEIMTIARSAQGDQEKIEAFKKIRTLPYSFLIIMFFKSKFANRTAVFVSVGLFQ
jgi:hypothetical protein